MCCPSNHVVVDSLTSQVSLCNYIHSQMLGRKTGRGLVTRDIRLLEISKYLSYFAYFFYLLAWKTTLLPLPSEKKEKKEIQISKREGIDEAEKLWLKDMMKPLL